MSEDQIGLPGWVDERLDEIFAGFPEDIATIRPARDAYALCLAQAQDAAEPGDGDDRCRATLLTALEDAGVDPTVLAAMGEVLEALEAEIGENT